LPASRLGSYEVAAGSPADGLQLYEWNGSASAALYLTLQTVEVVLRNALHQQLCPITHSWAQLTSTVAAVPTVEPVIPRQPRPR
jgi:hypothetical protein